MLTAISIRDIFLIEKLDIGFECGLTVLSGETSRASPSHSIRWAWC
jgi:DNA repair ATPase RecN